MRKSSGVNNVIILVDAIPQWDVLLVERQAKRGHPTCWIEPEPQLSIFREAEIGTPLPEIIRLREALRTGFIRCSKALHDTRQP